MPPGIERGRTTKLFEQPPLVRGQRLGNHDAGLGVQVTRFASGAGEPAAPETQPATARRTGGDLYLRVPTGGLHRHRCPERGLPRRERELHEQIAAFHAIARVRGQFHDEVEVAARRLAAAPAALSGKSNPLTVDQMEVIVRQFLTDNNLPEGYLGWVMVVLSSEFWRDQVAATSPSRRLFLLPHCLKHAEGCPADYDEFGLECKTCGACSIADFRAEAEKMGYKVLVAEGSPIVLKIIVSGHVDAIVGVACLNVLEKAIDKESFQKVVAQRLAGG